MGSVNIHWNGRCADAAMRSALLGKIGELSELSHAQFDTPPEARNFSHTINGEILIDPALLEGTGLEMPAESHAPGGLDLRAAGPLGVAKPQGPADFLRVSNVWLEGIEFRLFDGRGLYPGEDRMSFVFAFFDEYPALDGSLVFVEDATQCKLYRNQAVQQADFYLTSPTIHLRYYCEKWIDNLLAWIKRFYIPELTWWHYEPLTGYEAWASMDPANAEVRDAAWRFSSAASWMKWPNGRIPPPWRAISGIRCRGRNESRADSRNDFCTRSAGAHRLRIQAGTPEPRRADRARRARRFPDRARR